MIVIGIILFALLVIVHELGHLIMARRSGIEVEEFGLGFPPRLFGKHFGKSKTLISFNLIPLGGFVKLKGESDAAKGPGSFGRVSFAKKAKVLLAGVGMNVLAAYVLILILAWVGMPKLIDHQFTIASNERAREQTVLVISVLNDSPAAQAGLAVGDVIKSIDGHEFSKSQDLTDFTKAHPEQSVKLIVSYKGAEQTKTVTLAKTDNGEGRLGVVPFDQSTVRYSWSAPIVAAVLTLQLIWLTVVGLFSLIGGLISQGTSAPAVQGAVGPVGLFALLSSAGHLGMVYVLLLIISISISLAVLNTLPFPALDGGRLALIAAARVLKKPLTKKVETAVNTIGFVVLLLLAVLISIFDVKRFF